MEIVEYTPRYFDALTTAAVAAGNPNLCHRGFVDYYYHANNWCRLYLALSKDNEVIGAIGLEGMNFRHRDKDVVFGFGSNFFALQPGTGAYLFLRWIKNYPMALCFGGSDAFHEIVRRQKWTYYSGIRTLYLNDPYEVRVGEPLWRVWAKWLARNATRRPIAQRVSRLPRDVVGQVTVQEERSYGEDLLPTHSPFEFRFAPSPACLAWRYNTNLPFVRYRLFRITKAQRTVGYVVWSDSETRLLLSHCDGEDAETLSYGVLLTLIELTRGDRTPRTVVVSSSNPAMQRIFTSFGFRFGSGDRVFALGTRGRGTEFSSDTSKWLVNSDWGDNGLRSPFLDEPSH